MTTSLQVDPYASGGITSALNPTIPYGSGTTSMHGFQSMMQMQMMNKIINGLGFLKTSDPMLDGLINVIISTMLIGFISVLMSHFNTFIEQFKTLSTKSSQLAAHTAFNLNILFQKYILGRNISKKILRNVDIPYISDTRQINELYKAVFWFLTNDSEIDYLHEPYLQYYYDKKITIETREYVKKNLQIHKILSQQQTKTIKFKNHEIKYSLRTELITVYTDKDRKRENFKVNLSTVIDSCEQTDILDEFCQHCLTEYINNLTSSTWEQQIYINSGSEWKNSPSTNSRKLDTVILKKGLKDKIKNDLQLFLNSEDWYKERDIPYTRGYLFYGYPGTGKTSMIKGMSLHCKRHIHYLLLNEIRSDTELFELLKKINYKETVLVIEDIDAMTEIIKSRDKTDEEQAAAKLKQDKKDKKDKKNKNDESRIRKEQQTTLTLSGLLNGIDGVFSCHGRILIMTTNHPEVLDTALIRPGRIDSKFLFDNCNKEQIKGLYEMFFSSPINNAQLDNIEDVLYSPAHITSVFLRYRNEPHNALLNLNAIETKIVITPLIKSSKSKTNILNDNVINNSTNTMNCNALESAMNNPRTDKTNPTNTIDRNALELAMNNSRSNNTNTGMLNNSSVMEGSDFDFELFLKTQGITTSKMNSDQPANFRVLKLTHDQLNKLDPTIQENTEESKASDLQTQFFESFNETLSE
ncbi:MAG: AAA family ATPase [Gaeavirus sp.]|uniref:AAA family ATPase n=1 Tax=Gaeavirus sp. TaxID=2487767 RepID=A0A3G4ZZQ4_9VIRU|nr:MAG: AAA family ATPase [Gaeavirus sp.]